MAAKPAVSFCTYGAICTGLYFELKPRGCATGRQRLLFWMMAYTFMPPLELMLNGTAAAVFGNPDHIFCPGWAIQIREVSQWYVLIYLLQLEDVRE